MRFLLVGLPGLVLAFPGGSLYADVIQWADNFHFYEVIFADNPTWYEARDAASAQTHLGNPGHLATITTDAEQQFVTNSFGGGNAIDSLWVGGFQDITDPAYSEPDGAWKWITGEPWNIGPDKPYFSFNNNYFFQQTEEHLITWWGTGGLNDYYFAPYLIGKPPARGYIVEYVPEPCTLVLLSIACIGLLAYGGRIVVLHS